MRISSVFIVFIIISVFHVSSIATDSKDYRLPGNSRPLHYDLWLRIDIDQMRYNGSVQIQIELLEDTSSITLNYKDIEIDMDNVILMVSSGQMLRPITSTTDDDTEMITFTFDYRMIGGETYEIAMDFHSSIRTDLKGLYRSSYHQGREVKHIATTFLAAAYARMIFPCYDEPQLKAKFSIHISHAAKYHALSNSPILSQSQSEFSDDFVLTHFNITPIMSTYLVAFIVSDFEGNYNEKRTFNIYAHASEIDSTRYALDFGQQALQLLKIYFFRQYQMEKMDLVAIEDFLMGAMENWGLITYKSSNLLLKPETATTKQMIKISRIITHELTHQWFGNEVTCAWWSDVWLNEGFATYLEYFLTSLLHPEWRIMDQFLINEEHEAMVKDSEEHVRSMTKNITTPFEISEIYDFVAYPKAASVIRMFQHVMTNTVFQRAIQMYIEDRSYKASTPDDLFRVFQQAINLYGDSKIPPFKQIFESWSRTPGYPLLTVTRNYETTEVYLNQKRFLSNIQVHYDLNEKYFIPINYATKSNPDFYKTTATVWLANNADNMTMIDFNSKDWIIFNKQQSGYFRVNYDKQNWDMIIKELQGENFTRIHVLNRAQLIDDAFNLAQFGHLTFDVLLDLLSYLEHEKDFIPLNAGFKAMTYLNRMLFGHEIYDKFHNFLETLLAKIYSSMKASKESIEDIKQLLTTDVSSIACAMGVKDCISDAHKTFQNYKQIPNDIRKSMLCGAAQSSVAEWRVLKELFGGLGRDEDQKRENIIEYEELLYAMSCTKTRSLYEEYLQLSLNTTLALSPAERSGMFYNVLESDYVGCQTAITFLQANYLEIQSKYAAMENVFVKLADAIVTSELQNMLNELISKSGEHFTEAVKSVLYLTATKAEQNVQRVQMISREIADWMNANAEVENGDGKSSNIRLEIVCLLTAFVAIAFQRHLF